MMNAPIGRLIRYSVGKGLFCRTAYSLSRVRPTAGAFIHASSSTSTTGTNVNAFFDSGTQIELPPPWNMSSNWNNRSNGVDGKCHRVSLVIFDKDGTLICFNAMWIPWVKAIARRLSAMSGRDLSRDVYRLLGFCPVEERVRSGLLAEATMAQIQHRLVQMLSNAGIMPVALAKTVVDEAVKQCSSVAASDVREIHDTRHLFKQLRRWGIRVAICTADNRLSTSATLRALQLDSHVDYVICGDDENSLPKPHPHNALTICRALGVPVEEAAVVGDTLADMGMSHSAQLGMTVGVLSGVAMAGELEYHADYLLDDVGQLCSLIRAINVGGDSAYDGDEHETSAKITNYLHR